ncbi:DUF5325 family protein [Bacillus sp. AP8]|nr:DUF5325 family protein [Bacillus sp. AP8]
MMKQKLFFLLLSLLASASMAGIGISIAYRNIFGIILCILALCGVMGFGFSMKKKLRLAGKL